MNLTRESLVEWAASWVPAVDRQRFAEALAAELKAWREPERPPEFCKHCPFAKHVHYEEGGRLVTPSCIGFEAAPAVASAP